MIKKIKKIHSISLLAVAILSLIVWAIFQLTVVPDTKGEGNIVKRIYYQVVRLLPIKAAVKLAVPYHHQQHALSCEIASLLMALDYKGVTVTENQLIEQMPVSDPGPRDKRNVWGDPNVGFVGNINGTMPNTGYGVYEQPIYDLATKYRPAKIITNGTLTDLIIELSNGNPIVVWGVVAGRTKDISWKTPEGKTITAQLDEHARTLIGFTGTSNDPQLMILLDPIYGEIRLSAKDFLKNWALLEKKAVIIY
ncbi:MAG: hypothetical protein A3A24_00855 [Candidatus Buchananbacteria bacterium RIFCSPLOWO2_01_FULL_46_12]|uniref:Peptidase C39-like domain-containing protein n=1 Tax=Candidatus Buchananbacteria bacterium RIFCSPLOWO2_01_FULL_46_12 TaxID=1797546 RepID=A0A1G1YMY0_9BACT|nr:MAG: hypothetical protein A3A24_00855 [Candidatus Buchananbacteria bacterium RIFCSPLOWO2_01_FULL_46_12]